MTPLNDDEIKRVLVVMAHPDDCDFGAGGTIAQWTAKGIEVSYCIITNGDQGGEESGIPLEEMAQVRQKEQRDAGAALGVTDITYLNYRDGWLMPSIELRKEIVKAIRIAKPDRMLVQSPERNWERIFASHPDHLAAGETAIQAVYPDARNPYAFTDLKEAGFEPWRVREVWMTGSPTPNHFVDITETFDKKMAALHSHVSQTAHNKELENMVREWGQRNAEAQGLPAGKIVEIFKVINTD
ncbi:MAG: PIG-L family deacetylase [Candidatus Nanopelagicaceae bacterium]|nr:PIG-L family deacetylase [Candidatus Nanopelagicaceae bacterium]